MLMCSLSIEKNIGTYIHTKLNLIFQIALKRTNKASSYNSNSPPVNTLSSYVDGLDSFSMKIPI